MRIIMSKLSHKKSIKNRTNKVRQHVHSYTRAEMKALMPNFVGASTVNCKVIYNVGFTFSKKDYERKNIQNLTTNVPDGFKILIKMDKNNQICNFQPRVFNGVDLFSKYQGRICSVVSLLEEAINLYKKEIEGK